MFEFKIDNIPLISVPKIASDLLHAPLTKKMAIVVLFFNAK